jgi:hypothetical protein
MRNSLPLPLLHFLVSLFAFGLCTTPAKAQNLTSCSAGVMSPKPTGAKSQVNGFSIQVKTIPDPTFPPSNMACLATVTSPQGKVVYQVSDWGMEIDTITGAEINGDGQPDAVLVGYSGGSHCCFTYHIISLGTQPGLVRKFENGARASFDDLHGDRHIEISIRDSSFDYGFGLDNVHSVRPLLIVQLQGSKFKDLGAEFWPVFEKEVQQNRDKLTDKVSKEFLSSNPDDLEPDGDTYAAKSTILLIVLDYLYGGRYEDAQMALGEMWPAASQPRTWKEILGGYCTQLRANLNLESSPTCAEK